MARTDVLSMCDKALHELATALEAGHSQALTVYLSMMARFHRYSWQNSLLIAMQCPTASHVAGFRKWQQLGRYVKKGEKGIAIIAPCVKKKKEESDDETHSVLVGFRSVFVFDVSQTDGKPLPEFGSISGEIGDKLTRLEDFVRAASIELCYEDDLDGALGLSHGGRITVLEALSMAERFATLVHELAHELLHRGDRRSETTKTIRELEAEAVAYVVCRAMNLESEKCVDYIQLYRGDSDMLAESLEFIRSVSCTIISALETRTEVSAT